MCARKLTLLRIQVTSHDVSRQQMDMMPVQDTSSAMHQLRSARKAPPALPMPAAATHRGS